MSPDQIRFECLKLAISSVTTTASASALVASAREFADFVAGVDRTALAEEAKAAVDRAVR